MDKVKKLIEAGASVPGAIREALAQKGLSVLAFADQYELPYRAASGAINGGVRATDSMIDALVRELGGGAEEWRELLWLAAKPEGYPTTT